MIAGQEPQKDSEKRELPIPEVPGESEQEADLSAIGGIQDEIVAAFEGIEMQEGEEPTGKKSEQKERFARIETLEDLGAILKSERVNKSYRVAEKLIIDFMALVRSGDQKAINDFKEDKAISFINPRILDIFERKYSSNVKTLSDNLITTKGRDFIESLEKRGKLDPFMRIIYKRMAKEAEIVRKLASSKHPDGKPKSPEEIHEDFLELKEQIDSKSIEMNPFIQHHLESVSKGTSIEAAVAVTVADYRNLLTYQHIQILLSGDVPAERIQILKANIAHLEMTPDLADKIMSFDPETTTVDGKERKYYDAEAIGLGGFGRVFKVAVVKEDGTLEFCACKEILDRTGLAQRKEAKVMQRRQELAEKDLDMTHIMEYHSRSDNKKLFFMKLYKYTDKDGNVYQGSIHEICKKNPEVDNEILYRTLLGGGKALITFQKGGLIQVDAKIGNFVPAQAEDGSLIGVHIDLGEIILIDDFVNGPLGETQIQPPYIHGTAPEGIGITAGIFSDEIYRLIRNGSLAPEKYHNYTFGVAIETLVTGKIYINKMAVDDPEKLIRGELESESQQVYAIRPLTSPPYANDANEQLLQLAKELKNPRRNDVRQGTPKYDDTYEITMEEAVERLERILNTKQNT